MIDLVISGGQTGADRAGWFAATTAGIKTGGWMPRGYMAEDGPHPSFGELYGAQEHPSAAYPPRTRANVKMADVTLVFDCSNTNALAKMSRGSRLTIETAMEFAIPSISIRVDPSEFGRPIPANRSIAMAEELAKKRYQIVNIAGNRESSFPGIGKWVEEYMTEVFRLMKAGQEPLAVESNMEASRA